MVIVFIIRVFIVRRTGTTTVALGILVWILLRSHAVVIIIAVVVAITAASVIVIAIILLIDVAA